jgi:hypothetical protein
MVKHRNICQKSECAKYNTYIIKKVSSRIREAIASMPILSLRAKFLTTWSWEDLKSIHINETDELRSKFNDEIVSVIKRTFQMIK